MDRDLIIQSKKDGVEIALLEDRQLTEFHQDAEEHGFNVGDIILGRIRKINPGLNAAFVDVGYERDGFLHYTDLGPQIRTAQKVTNASLNRTFDDFTFQKLKTEKDIIKTGKMNNVLSKKHPILVQIAKEPISTKGPRLTSEISLAGRFLVLVPFSEGVGVSKKIESAEERKRLGKLIESIKPPHFAVVVRTVATGKGVADLHGDLTDLLEKWKKVCHNLADARAPKRILNEIDKTSGILRDLLNDSFNRVWVDDKQLQADVQEYIGKIAPGKEKIVSLHVGKRSLFDTQGITRQIKSAFGKTVTMKSGAYLVIEHTEAMHVVDVNSGNKMANARDQDQNVLNINKESVREVARQARLRDMGGIIIIDLIDMRNPEFKKQVVKEARDAMSKDRAQHTILPITRFGLLQITRQRVKPEVNITTEELCPSCQGTGKIGASINMVNDIQRNLEQLIDHEGRTGIKLVTHPFIEAFLSAGNLPDYLDNSPSWMFWKKSKIKILADDSFGINKYKIFDQKGEEIVLS